MHHSVNRAVEINIGLERSIRFYAYESREEAFLCRYTMVSMHRCPSGSLRLLARDGTTKATGTSREALREALEKGSCMVT